jgi:hypothetical protein
MPSLKHANMFHQNTNFEGRFRAKWYHPRWSEDVLQLTSALNVVAQQYQQYQREKHWDLESHSRDSEALPCSWVTISRISCSTVFQCWWLWTGDYKEKYLSLILSLTSWCCQNLPSTSDLARFCVSWKSCSSSSLFLSFERIFCIWHTLADI